MLGWSSYLLIIDTNISSWSKFSGIGSLKPMPSAISLKYLKSILVSCLELINGLTVGQKCCFFLDHLRNDQWSTAFFLHFSDIDTLVSEHSVPFIIFRARMFIFYITHHVPFIHNFPPFTIHIGYIILPYGFRFQGGVKIHDIIHSLLNACNTGSCLLFFRFSETFYHIKLKNGGVFISFYWSPWQPLPKRDNICIMTNHVTDYVANDFVGVPLDKFRL